MSHLLTDKTILRLPLRNALKVYKDLKPKHNGLTMNRSFGSFTKIFYSVPTCC